MNISYSYNSYLLTAIDKNYLGIIAYTLVRDFMLPRGVNGILALLSYYVASSGNSLPTFRDNSSVSIWFHKRNIATVHFVSYVFRRPENDYVVVATCSRMSIYGN